MKHWIGIIVRIAFLIGVIASIAGCKNASNQTMTSPTTVEFGGVNSISSKSKNGLSLSLSLDSTTYQLYQYVTIVIDEKNTLLKTNDVRDAEEWRTNELSLGFCTYGPFGIAVFQGYYTSSDFSAAAPLVIFDPSPRSCPSAASPSSYSFQPSSDIANLNIDSNPGITIKNQEISAEIPMAGYWSKNSPNSFSGFEPGVYTVLAGDEWGALVMLHFTITNTPNSSTQTIVNPTSNQQPIEVISVLGPFQPFYPGGSTVEITLKNVSIEPVVSLTAIFTGLGPREYNFVFDVNSSNALLSDGIISDKLSLVNGAFSNNITYPLTITGTLQDGVTFSFTQAVPIVEVSSTAG